MSNKLIDFIKLYYIASTLNNRRKKSNVVQLNTNIQEPTFSTIPSQQSIQKQISPIGVIIQNNDYTGKVDNYTNKIIDGLFRVKEIAGTGIIDQFLVKSTSNDYTIDITVDNRIYGNQTFNYYSDLSKYIANTSAFLKDGYYYLSMREIRFQNNFMIALKTTSSTTFDEIILKYTVREERNV